MGSKTSFAKKKKRELGPWSSSMNLSRVVKSQYCDVNSPVAVWNDVNSATLNLNRSRSGVITVKPHKAVTNATRSEYNTFRCTPTSAEILLPTYPYYHKGVRNYYLQMPSWNFTSVDLVALQNLCKTKLVKKSRGAANLIQTVGEFPETVHMVAGYINKLTGAHNKHTHKISRDIKVFSRTKTTPASFARFIAEKNLEYSFGIAPFISDAQAIGEAVGNALNGLTDTRVRSFVGKEVLTPFDDVTVVPGNVPSTLSWKRSGFVKENHRVICGGTYTGDALDVNNNPEAIKRAFGVGIKDIIPSIYELIPYSWLLDYFTNIGDMLTVWSTDAVYVRDTWMVVISEYQVEATYRLIEVPGWKTIESTPGVQRGTHFTFSRSSLDLKDWVPPFTLKNPGWKQIANIASVAAQRIIPLQSVYQRSPRMMNAVLSLRKSLTK